MSSGNRDQIDRTKTATADDRLVRHEFFAMGSRCEVCIDGLAGSEALRLGELAEAEVVRIEKRYSRFRPDSELARINAAAQIGGPIDVDAETAALLTYAAIAYERSDGLFDPTSGLLRQVWSFSEQRVPAQAEIDILLPRIGFDKVELEEGRVRFLVKGMALDLGGLGKEYAADRAAEICAANGATSGFVNLGGDIRIVGERPTGQWEFGVSDPRAPGTSVAVVRTAVGGVATSGDYERYFERDGRRYCHILNPKTGWPAQGLRSATVVADTTLLAGTLSTTAMLKGSEALSWLNSLGVEFVLVDEQAQLKGRSRPRN